MNDKIKIAEKLIQDVKDKKAKWNEHSQFVMKGIKNLSVSDMDLLVLYAETIIYDGYYTGLLMKPPGGVGEVIKKYGLLEENNFIK